MRFDRTLKSFLALCLGTMLLGQGLARNQEVMVLFELLERVPAGQSILKSARNFWKVTSNTELSQYIVVQGDVSKTDATITRRIDTETGKEDRERRTRVIIRSDQSYFGRALDLAHELIHAVYGPNWDPYDPKLSAIAYIKAALEGEGGEIRALTQECSVGLELLHLYEMTGQFDEVFFSRCQRYVSKTGQQIEQHRIAADFYRVGKWYPRLVQELGAQLDQIPLLSSESVQLYSSTGNAPYPAALAEEYKSLTDAACMNSLKRLESLSLELGAHQDSRQRAENFLRTRCHQSQLHSSNQVR